MSEYTYRLPKAVTHSQRKSNETKHCRVDNVSHDYGGISVKDYPELQHDFRTSNAFSDFEHRFVGANVLFLHVV